MPMLPTQQGFAWQNHTPAQVGGVNPTLLHQPYDVLSSHRLNSSRYGGGLSYCLSNLSLQPVFTASDGGSSTALLLDGLSPTGGFYPCRVSSQYSFGPSSYTRKKDRTFCTIFVLGRFSGTFCTRVYLFVLFLYFYTVVCTILYYFVLWSDTICTFLYSGIIMKVHKSTFCTLKFS